jgi:hypothetical protein
MCAIALTTAGQRSPLLGGEEGWECSVMGRATDCVLSCLMFPFVLLWTAVRVYWFPCLGTRREVIRHAWRRVYPPC